MDNSLLPNINEPAFFPFPDFQSLRLDNGIPVHVLPFNHLGYTNVSFSIKSGILMQSKLLQASLTNRMLREGCEGFSSEELAEELDFYGTALRNGVSMLGSEIETSVVSRHLPKVLPTIKKVVFSPTFPEKEFGICREIARQSLIHSMQEVSFLARRQLKTMLYGERHPYAASAGPDDYDQISISDLKDFHSEFYLPSNFELYVSGRFSEAEFDVLNGAFGSLPVPRIRIPKAVEPAPATCADVRRLVVKPDCVQNSVAIGAITISKYHPDYLKLKLLVAVLGGYFGSRLMSNIREDKGYTYGIFAQLKASDDFSAIKIYSDTATEYTNSLIDEVFVEINRLTREPVPAEELEMVKRYFTGMYLQQVSKGIGLLQDMKVKLLQGVDPRVYCQNWWDVLHNTTPDELLIIAKKYLKPADFRISIAGKAI